MIPKSLLSFLDKNKIKYEILKHRVVYTAIDKAATLKTKPAQIVKTVIVSLDNKTHALALIPANKNLDKKKLLKLINNSPSSPSYFKRGIGGVKFSRLDFADERWMKANLKGIKVGATPAFGIFYKLPTFIDGTLVNQPKLIVNAGDYQNSLKIAASSLFKLDKAIVKGSFSQKKN